MQTGLKPIAMTLLALALLACGQAEERRQGLSADEERQLDNAAKMLDDNMVIDTSGETDVNGQ